MSKRHLFRSVFRRLVAEKPELAHAASDYEQEADQDHGETRHPRPPSLLHGMQPNDPTTTSKSTNGS